MFVCIIYICITVHVREILPDLAWDQHHPAAKSEVNTAKSIHAYGTQGQKPGFILKNICPSESVLSQLGHFFEDPLL